MSDLITTSATVLIGDVRERIAEVPDGSVQCVVTSPPYYGLRSYGGGDAEIGLEATPQAYVDEMVQVFREVRRVLADDGTLWLNLGDSYGTGGSGQNFYDPDGVRSGGGRTSAVGGMGHKKQSSIPGIFKQLLGIPWRVAFALQADGWYLRQDIIWSKPNPMPESVKDRCTKSHEYLFLLTKSPRYYYDAIAIAEDASDTGGALRWRKLFDPTKQTKVADMHRTGQTGAQDGARNSIAAGKRNRRSVWSIATQPYSGAHFAVMPPALVEPCILAGSREGDTVFDPFTGSGTTLEVAQRLGRKAKGIELNPAYLPLIRQRLAQQPLVMEVPA